VASLATATRLLFSMARDNIFPFSARLAGINRQRQAPQVATVVIWLFSTLVIFSFRRIEIITSVGTVAAYLGYAGIMLATILSSQDLKDAGGFSLGRWRRPVQVSSLLWTLSVVAALSIPETEIEGIASKHLPVQMALLAALLGVLLYIFFVRRKINSGQAGPPGC
jgi:amino acid transporter